MNLKTHSKMKKYQSLV